MKNSTLALTLSLSALLAAGIAAQQGTFKSSTELVTVDVTVLDKNGKPVPGLTADDFEIKLNGKPQPVRTLAFLSASASPAPAAAAAEAAAPVTKAVEPAPAAAIEADPAVRHTWSNLDLPAGPAFGPPASTPVAAAPPAVKAAGAEPRVFIILIDDLSFTATRGRALFASAQRFVDMVPATDPVGFTTTSGSTTVNPTMDRQAVKLGLAKIVGEFMDPRMIRKGNPNAPDAAAGDSKDQPISFTDAIDIDRGDESLLLDVIVRECFGGDRQAVVGQTAMNLVATNQCASDISSETRRTAGLMRQLKGRQVASISSVINAMTTASGIRHLIVVTDGMAVSREVEDWRPIVRAAAASGVQISVMMEDPEAINMDADGRRGFTDVSPQTDPGMSARVRDDNRLMLNGAQTVTDMAGGLFYKVAGSADGAFARIIEASSAVYRLAIEAPAGAAPGKELTLSASVRKPGLTVRSNKVAIITPASAAAAATATPAAPAAPPSAITQPRPNSPSDLVLSALNAAANVHDVPIRLAAAVRRSASAEGKVDISVNVHVPATLTAPIAAVVGLVDDKGVMKVSKQTVQPGVVPFLFPVDPGKYRVRFGVVDAAGSMGTIDVPVVASLHPMGDFTTSDVITWVVDAAANKANLFSMDDVPAGADVLNASLELYPKGTMPDEPPTVHWTVRPEGSDKAVVDEDTDAHPNATFFRADFEIPWASLPAGTYLIKAEFGGAGVSAVVKKN